MPTRNDPSFLQQRSEKHGHKKSPDGYNGLRKKTKEDEKLSIQENLQQVLVVATHHLTLTDDEANASEETSREILSQSALLSSKSDNPDDETAQPTVIIDSCQAETLRVNEIHRHSVNTTPDSILVETEEEKEAGSSGNSSETSKPVQSLVETSNGHEMNHPSLLSSDTNRVSLFIKSNRTPSDFFNLARKFLAKSTEIDLIAMETAIIVAVDTANLLERSKYATICRVMTDNVDNTMEFRFDTGAPIRRSRICITIRRTLHYTNWLQDNT